MKKRLSFLLSFIFTFLFFSFFSSKSALAKGTDCYVGSTRVGTLSSNSSGGGFVYFNFLVPGNSGWLYFDDKIGDVRSSEPVLYKVGNSGWQQTNYNGYSTYTGSFTVDNDPCGNCWLNVRWRSNTDGQLHYCNLLMPKYTSGKSVDPYLNAGCIYSNCTAQKAPSEDSRVYAYNLVPVIPDLTPKCEDYTLQVEDRSYNFTISGNPFAGIPYKCITYASFDGSLPSDGKVDAHISYSGPPPAVDPNTITYDSNKLRFYNFVSNTYCGGAIVDVTPTPTPTPTPVSCPLAIQSMSFSGSGTPLINDYNTTQYKGSPQYTTFTANKNGRVSKVEIYGTLDRNIPKGGKVLQCKITDSLGNNPDESSTNNGAFKKGVSWMGVSFSTPVNIVNGTSYRLYCKVNNVFGGSFIYWLDFWNNRTDKTHKIYLCN